MKPAPPVTRFLRLNLLFMASSFLHELRGFVEALDRADVEPLFLENIEVQRAFFEVELVDVGYLILAAFARRYLSYLFEDRVVIDVKPRHCQIAFRFLGFFLKRGYFAALHGSDAESLRVTHFFEKYSGALFEFLYGRSDVIKEDVISQEQDAIVLSYIIFRDKKAVGDAIRLVLYTVYDLYLFRGRGLRDEVLARTEKPDERVDMMRRGDDHYLRHSRVDQFFYRIVDDRLVEYRQ